MPFAFDEGVSALSEPGPNHKSEIDAALELARAGKYGEAFSAIDSLSASGQNCAQSWCDLAEIARLSGAFETALDAATRAVAADKNNPLTHTTLGLALAFLNRHEESCAAFLAATKLEPRIALLWRNVGLSYQFMNKLDDAENAYLQFIQKSGAPALSEKDAAPPDEKAYSAGHWDLALIDLLRGNYKRGFARFRARFKALSWLARPSLPRPLWRGENLEGQTILVHDEQGLGDCLMMARFLPLLRARGARVRFLVQSALVPLFEAWGKRHCRRAAR